MPYDFFPDTDLIEIGGSTFDYSATFMDNNDL